MRLKNFHMRTRFLLGPAGSGKTFRCLAEIREELKSAPDGLPLVLLAPKQATFQLERQLLAGADLPGYTRLQILSFERLAEFVLAEFPPPAGAVTAQRTGLAPPKQPSQHSDGQREFPLWELQRSSRSEQKASERDLPSRASPESITKPQRILDEEGRVMVLRALLAQKQKELKTYRATARLPGFAQQLSLLLREMQRHQHSPEKLFALAAQFHLRPQLADKLHDLALLLRAYHEWLKEHRLQDVNSLLDLATEALRLQPARRDGLVVKDPTAIAKTTRHEQPFADDSAHRPAQALVSFGGLWLDGFAEMTPQELDFLASLTPLCARATLAFCLENTPAGDLSWLSTWAVVGQTFRKSYQRLAGLPGCEVEVEILERKPNRGRFLANSVLAHLEQNWPQPKPYEGRVANSSDKEQTAMARGGSEPTPNPSREGSRTSWPVPLLGGARGGLVCAKSMERRNDGPGLPDSLRVAICATPEAEVVLAAREILRHVRAGGRFRDCAVLLRTHAGYHDALRRVFQRYEIPFFLDRRESVAHHPLAELSRYALRTVALGWEHDDWMGALKTGLVPGDEAEFDALENQALARGWKADAWKQPLRIPDEELLEKRLERLRENIIPPFEQLAKALAADHDAVHSQPTGSHLAEALRQFWAQFDVEETLDRWGASEPGHSPLRTPHAKIHATVMSQMQSWLDNVAMAFPGDRLPLRDWLPILEAGLAGLTVGVIPPALDHVLVGTIDRSRNPELELALVLGLNESVFPAVPQLTGLLTESDREHLEARQIVLGPNKLAQLGHERYYGYIACTRARRRLVMTCAQRDANHRPLSPSPFLAHVKRLFPSLEVQYGPEPEQWLASEHASELQAPLLRTEVPGSDPPVRSLSSLASLPGFASFRDQLRALASYAPADSFSPALAEQLFGPALRTSVSALEQFAACPFKFFVHFGLRAEERKYFEADARERGSFQHTILAQFHEELQQEGKRWRDLAPEEARARVGRIARQTVDEFREGLFDASDQNRFAGRSLAGALEDFIGILISWMQAYAFDPHSVELAFGGEGDPLPGWEIDLGDGHSLLIRGKIDRVDLAVNPGRDEALCSVIDYKSGAKRIDPLLLQHGIQIQLPAYLAALRHVADPRPVFGVERLVPAGVFYVSLRGSYTAGENRSAVLNGVREAGLLAYRHAGRFRFDALKQFDRHAPTGNSGQFNYALRKDGKPNRRSADLLETEEFNALLDHVEGLLREMGRRILTGDAKVDPYRKGTEVACDFCDSRAICRIDRWTHPFRVLKREPAAPRLP
jgi:ATP-dependent helicase/nuclease subunit B